MSGPSVTGRSLLSDWAKSLPKSVGGSIYRGVGDSRASPFSHWPFSAFSSSEDPDDLLATPTLPASARIRQLTSPLIDALQFELLPLILCEVGFVFVTAFAAYEVWVTRRHNRRHLTNGNRRNTSTVVPRLALTNNTSGIVAGGRGTLPNSMVTGALQQPKRSSYMYDDFRRGSVDTHDGRQSSGSLEAAEAGSRGGRGSVMSSGVGRDGAGGPSDGESKDSQSSGDSTRRAFFNLLFIALLSRLLLLPVQAFFFSPSSHDIHPDSGMCMSLPACIFSRTLPDICFASAFSLLVLFYAQLAGTASGGGPQGLSYILTRRRLFQMANIIVYAIYTLLFIFTAFVPHVPYALFQTSIWSMLCIIYAALLLTLSYFGPQLLKLLRPSLARRSALAMRLITTCIVCAAVFFSRTVCFAIAVYDTDYKWAHGIVASSISSDAYRTQFDQNLLGYTMLELLPSVIILAMMHQRAPRSESSQSPSAAAGTTPPVGMGYGPPRSAAQIAALAADGNAPSPGRLSPGQSCRLEWSGPGRGSMRRSLSGSAAPTNSGKKGLGVDGAPLLEGRGGLGPRGYGATTGTSEPCYDV
jgi:hypothetical protein